MMRTIVLVLGVFLAGLVAAQEPNAAPVAPKRVQFSTSDGVTVVASYFAPAKATKEKKAPCAILVHMFRSNRDAWMPLVPGLLDAGFAVLAYDIRGGGESLEPAAKKLTEGYTKRDAAFFADCWKDAEAAAKWLGEQEVCDAKKIVMVGASVGCSISIDFAARSDAVKGVICLSPGTNYMSLDSVAHVKALGKRRVLLIAPEGEKAAPEELKKANDAATVDIRAGDQKNHGTRMFAAEYGKDVIKAIVTFAKDS